MAKKKKSINSTNKQLRFFKFTAEDISLVFLMILSCSLLLFSLFFDGNLAGLTVYDPESTLNESFFLNYTNMSHVLVVFDEYNYSVLAEENLTISNISLHSGGLHNLTLFVYDNTSLVDVLVREISVRETLTNNFDVIEAEDLIYSRQWTAIENTGYSGGKALFSNSKHKSIETQFNGTSICILYSVRFDFGILDILLDDKNYSINETSENEYFSNSSILGLSEGEHNISFVVSSNDYVTLDALVPNLSCGDVLTEYTLEEENRTRQNEDKKSVIDKDYFDGEDTTQINESQDLTNITNLILHKKAKAKVNWNKEVNIADADILGNVKIDDGFLSINSKKLSELNTTARIVFENTSCDSYQVFYSPDFFSSKDKVADLILIADSDSNCTSDTLCLNITCQERVLSFYVDHFSTYLVNTTETTVYDFLTATFNGTDINSSTGALTLNNSLYGTYTSQIFDAGTSTSWNWLNWSEEGSYGSQLPNFGQSQNGFNMTNNVLLLHFDNSLTDSSGNANHALGESAAYSTTPRFGSHSLTLDGINDYVTVSNDTFDNYTTFSLGFWFRPSETYSESTSYVSFVHAPDFEVFISDGAMVFERFGQNVSSTTTTWTADTWYHVFVVYDGSSQAIFVNSENEHEIVVSGLFEVKNDSDVTIAKFFDSGNIMLKGTCQAGGCTDPGSDAFIVLNSSDSVVAYINSTGSMCVSDSDCNDFDLDCSNPGDGAFTVKFGDDIVSYINSTGHLCLKGDLIENSNP